jgi:xylulokinase
MSYYAGLDAGTQSIKLLVYDADTKQVIAQTSAPLALISKDDGTREQLASWWLEAVHLCFHAVPGAIRSGICAIAVSGQQHGFVALGRTGEVLAPVKLWCDTSSSAECTEIMTAVGGEARCIALVGNPILAGYTASKVRWTKRHRPDAYQALASMLLPHDYLNYYLTGERYCEFGDASGTGWLDVRQRCWSQALLTAIDDERELMNCLPPLVSAHAMFPIRPQVALALGLSPAVQIGAGGGDNMMAAIGTACVAPGRLSISLGTSGTLFAYADHPVISPHGEWAAFCASTGGWLPLICTMNCTVATETAARIFGYQTRQSDAFIAQTRPGAEGLTMLPFFNGERTPNLPHARGALLGMDLNNARPENLHRAAMEAASYSLRNGFDAFSAAGLKFDAISLTGGGSQSPAWRQMIADVFNLPVAMPKQSEGAAFGAALQALWASELAQGSGRTLVQIVGEHVQVDSASQAQPVAANVQAYYKPYQRFLQLVAALRPLYRSAFTPL